MQILSSGNRDLLEARGFEIAELTGFESNSLPLYTHRLLGDKKPGDVVLRARVGNPESLDDSEASYLARKAFHGMFPWMPGEDCVKRTFLDVTINRNGTAGDNQVQQSEPTKGCRWCRSVRRKSTGQRKRSKVANE